MNELLIGLIPIALIAVVVLILLITTIKVVSGNEVLVVTGVGATKRVIRNVKVFRDGEEVIEKQVTYEPKIRIAGASVVIPIIQQARKFDICVMKAEQKGDTMKTITGVEVDIDWGISYAPNADSVESLQPCIRQFLDKDKQEIEDIIKSAVAGGLRAVISTMTPKDVMIGKDTLDDKVQKNISTQMNELGYKVQLYIQEVRDTQGSSYYYDLAAQDREDTRRNAANITAEADRAIRAKRADAEQQAKDAELESEVAIAAKTRDAMIKKAMFKSETDKANADASVAGQLQIEERKKELAEKEGQVEVMKQEQANLAAQKEQTVRVTRAETSKKEAIIKAEADSEQQQINAAAKAAVMVKDAEGRADAMRQQANADAEATKLRAAAEAEKVRAAGEAEADAIAAKGKAEAASIEARGKAEAESARALSDAQAANDRVNFEIRKLEIERDTRIQIATNVAQAMANVGEKATFYDFSGGSNGGTDLLSSVLGNIPQLFAKANLTNEALNGEKLTETIRSVTDAVTPKRPEATLNVVKSSESVGNEDSQA